MIRAPASLRRSPSSQANTLSFKCQKRSIGVDKVIQFTLKSRYYFTRLSDFEKKIYREIYDCWVTGSSVAKITFPGTSFTLPSGMELHKLVTYIIDENPHLFHLETSQFHYSRIGSQVSIQADHVYSSDEYKRIYAKLTARVEQIVHKAKHYRTDYEKLRYLHDYLAENISYDTGLPDPRSQREVHTIVGALLNSACVCDGYARAYRLLCDQLHLSCIVAIGNSTAMDNNGPHAWNFVKLDNRVYHVDVTWDSCLISSNCPVTDYYFLRNDAVFSKEHSWDSTLYPPIIEDYPRKEPMIFNKIGLEQYICEKVKTGGRDLLFQLPDNFPGGETLQQRIKEIVARNDFVFRKIKSYSTSYYNNIKYAQIHFE